jgi:tRNA pseudouridine38-40 synthase
MKSRTLPGAAAARDRQRGGGRSRRPGDRDGGGAAPPGGWESLRLDLEYEGTRYSGWQEQQNARTVAGELRQANTGALGHGQIVELGGAGRTDGGVHALGQVAHLRLRRGARPHDPERLRRAINDALPADIDVLRVTPAANRFHARHDAELRSYVYQIALRRTALAKRFVWWVREPLDRELLATAWSAFVGRHDFRNFCERPEAQDSTLVVVDGCELAADGHLLLLRISASHFLWKMVRRLVGTAVRVAAGDATLDELATLLAGGTLAPGPGGEPRTPAAWTAPASGLFLERVVYRGEPALAPLRAPVPVL